MKALADSDEAIARRIAEIAAAHLSDVDLEEVVGEVYDELDALEVEDVWDRARRVCYGYVDPGNAADRIIEKEFQP